ncbi:MAG: OmpA family protein, partial [Rhodobacterales bacterium]|nr:OmpA family protein [Rhodobacterales bacterium]
PAPVAAAEPPAQDPADEDAPIPAALIERLGACRADPAGKGCKRLLDTAAACQADPTAKGCARFARAEEALAAAAVAAEQAESQGLKDLLATPEVAAALETLNSALAPAPGEQAAEDTSPLLPAAIAAALGAAAATDTPAPVAETESILTEDQARTATEDFGTALTTAAPTADEAKAKKNKDGGLSDLEKAGLLALGAVAVGMLVGDNRVVANSGDRVVVQDAQGDLAVLKDDNAHLRAAGDTEKTVRYADGSTLTTLTRADGSRIETVRDATGRVIWRERVNADGSRVALIDDTQPVAPVQVSRLPEPQVTGLTLESGTDPALVRALLDEASRLDLGRSFSLAQVRTVPELRRLAPELSGDPITFATGSAAIRPDEAGKLLALGRLMQNLIAEDPSEIFLIEGHTDATGGAALNLALSDRRAESVALALTQFFGVPAENMVVQGYGESQLKIATEAAEERNRRVAVRRITWLVHGS